MRLPLATDIKTTVSDTANGERLFNALTESRGGLERVKKRPGLVNTTYAYTSPQGVGTMNGLLVMIYSDTIDIVSSIEPPPAEILLGDLVDGYYALLDNPPDPPGGSSPYWSASAPSMTPVYRAYISVTDYSLPSLSYAITVHPETTTANYRQIFSNRALTLAAAAAHLTEVFSSVGSFVVYATLDADPANQYALDQSSGVVWSVPLRIDLAVPFYVSGGYILSGDTRIASGPSGLDWTSVFDPTQVSSSYGSWLGYEPFLHIKTSREKTVSNPTITRVGSQARMVASELNAGPAYHPPFSEFKVVQIAGCDQPEYNGTFELTPNYDGSGNLLYYYFTVSGSPATPATGTRTVKHFFTP